MTFRLRRQTPRCGYAEVEVVHHSGSHHQPGDVILMDWEEYERGKFVTPPDAPPPAPEPKSQKKEMSQAVADFLAINPHIHTMADSIPPKGTKNDTRRKSKGKNHKTLKRL